jgi:hypothetical protein
MIQYRLADFEAHAEALQPCRQSSARSCSHQPETPDVVSSRVFASTIRQTAFHARWGSHDRFARRRTPTASGLHL